MHETTKKTPRSFPRGVFDFWQGSLSERAARRDAKIAPYLLRTNARQFLIVFDVHNFELFGVHAGVGAE